MSNERKICVVTGTRAEYGLLQPLMCEIADSKKLELQVLVTGMHLSPEFGLTWKTIEEDGFQIDKKVEMLLSSDSPTGISKSMGLGMIGFAEAFDELKPDIVLVLGDRYEIFAAAAAATNGRFPIAHIHGGETSEGAVDEAFRHSVTKMSVIHFAATDEYRKRIIQLGEHPDRVFNVGAPGIDNITKLKLMCRSELEQSISFQLGKKNLLVTYHPVTLESMSSESQFSELLKAIDEIKDCKIIFTKPNSDAGGRVIIRMIDEYINKHPGKSVAFTSMGQLRYLSALQYIDGVVGNSSSGLIEVPSFKKGTINIGDRQKGRMKGDSIIDCQPDYKSIKLALEQLFSSTFSNILKNSVNPYGNGGATQKILKVLESANLQGVLKKSFYNL